MNNEFDDIVQKRFAQIKRLAFLLFGALVVMLGLCVAADLPIEEGPPDIEIALLLTVIIIFLCGVGFSRLHKIKWVKAKLIGRDAVAVNEKKVKRASGCFLLFFICSFVSWFNLGAWGLVGSIFLGGKFWLAIFGVLAIVMMVITWPKRDELFSFVEVD